MDTTSDTGNDLPRNGPGNSDFKFASDIPFGRNVATKTDRPRKQDTQDANEKYEKENFHDKTTVSRRHGGGMRPTRYRGRGGNHTSALGRSHGENEQAEGTGNRLTKGTGQRSHTAQTSGMATGDKVQKKVCSSIVSHGEQVQKIPPNRFLHSRSAKKDPKTLRTLSCSNVQISQDTSMKSQRLKDQSTLETARKRCAQKSQKHRKFGVEDANSSNEKLKQFQTEKSTSDIGTMRSEDAQAFHGELKKSQNVKAKRQTSTVLPCLKDDDRSRTYDGKKYPKGINVTNNQVIVGDKDVRTPKGKSRKRGEEKDPSVLGAALKNGHEQDSCKRGSGSGRDLQSRDSNDVRNHRSEKDPRIIGAIGATESQNCFRESGQRRENVSRDRDEGERKAAMNSHCGKGINNQQEQFHASSSLKKVGDKIKSGPSQGLSHQKQTGASCVNSQRKISLQVLKSWSENKDNEELLIQITTQIESLEKLLMSNTLEEEWYERLVQVFTATITCPSQSTKLKRLLKVLSASHFLTHLLTNYLDSKQVHGFEWTEADQFFNSILNIIGQIVKYFPEGAQSCKWPLKCLRATAKFIPSAYIRRHTLDSIISILSFVTETHKKWMDGQTRMNFYRPNNDKEIPPENFRDVSVIPTAADLSSDANPFVRAVITKGAYKDQEHYLDVQFRLMREDFMRPLRSGILEYQEHGHNKKFKSSDRNIRLYHDVHFTGLSKTKWIDHVVQFDVSNMKHFKWDHSKRLLNGNLLCLSNDNFESNLIFATVSFRDIRMLRRGIVNIICLSGMDIVLKASPMDSFVMAETMAYYEAVHPILKGLQTIESDLPMQEYIVLGQKQLKPPSYLLKEVRKYDIAGLMKDASTTEVSVLNPLSWPSTKRMCLNSSQREAAILALTKEVSLIQGPPGTGKTYVGLKIMQVLLQNQDRIVPNERHRNDPILVICYTNHALDQFLEGILKFCPNGILRVGGKSSSDVLEPFNLMNMKKHSKSSYSSGKVMRHIFGKLEKCSAEVKRLKRNVDSLTTDVVSENELMDHIDRAHADSLSKGPRDNIYKSKIHQWLDVPNESLLQVLPEMIKDHLTRLVMKCLGVQFLQLASRKLTLGVDMSIIDRIRLYKIWLSQYQHDLRMQINANRNSKGQGDIDYFSSQLHHSQNSHILNDSEICYVIRPEDLQRIWVSVHQQNAMVKNEDRVVEAWVLGTHNGCNKQMDDIENLKSFIRSSGREKNNNGDDFDDEEESKNAIRQRQYYEDYDEERELFDATLEVTNEGSFLLHRARSLGISDDHEVSQKMVHENEFQTVLHKKHKAFLKVKRMLEDKRCPPKSEEEIRTINDVWKLDLRDRFALYKLWILRYKESLVARMENLMEEQNVIKQELTETRMKEDVDIMKKAKVIGMTTTGAAKKRAWLEEVGCRIIVVEEAAEVLEAHIVTALNKNCQHLILIGDHKQLRPNPTVYEHAIKFGLDVSLFERLINNDIPHVTLNEQHRMRESISVVMHHIYPTLQDHTSVKRYENVRGVSKNIFFIQHDHDESTVKDSHSKSNPFEAKYLVRLCKYFLLQGYHSSQITILATYGGQVLALKKEMNDQTSLQGVRVSTVDNFQGEENDIILLSLVRSNQQSTAGFLKVDNRVCVALSRAKKGMFVIGNLKLLASQSRLWANIKLTAEKEGTTGDGLPISCPNHPEEKNVIKVPEDFDCSPEGGCQKKCEFRLDCGHICRLKCHGYDLEHTEVKCFMPCTKSCPEGHPCPKKCWSDCGDCVVKVLKEIRDCGHSNEFPCSKSPKAADCYTQCETILACGHRCSGKCGHCNELGNHPRCKIPMTYTWPCGHAVKVPCHFKPSEHPCPKKCGEMLNCGHTCPGTCGDCLEGAVHVACTQRCDKTLMCGHMCRGFCGTPCPPCSSSCQVACQHGSCNLKCKEECTPCDKPCANACSHRKCTRLCHEVCDVKPCQEHCKRILTCGHFCAGLCGELCVCKKCESLQLVEGLPKRKQTQRRCNVFLKIPSCKHIFKLDEIDEYVKLESRKFSSKFICCPSCSTPIQQCNRYERIVKENWERQADQKTRLQERYFMSSHTKKTLRQDLQKVDKKLNFREWHSCNQEEYTSLKEATVVTAKLKFAFVISVIASLQDDGVTTDPAREVEDRVRLLLKVGNDMSRQQMEECIVDLKRLFLRHYLIELKGLFHKHGSELPEDFNEEYATAIKDLKLIKPAAQLLMSAQHVMRVLENALSNVSMPSDDQKELGIKKKLSKQVVEIFNSIKIKMSYRF